MSADVTQPLVTVEDVQHTASDLFRTQALAATVVGPAGVSQEFGEGDLKVSNA